MYSTPSSSSLDVFSEKLRTPPSAVVPSTPRPYPSSNLSSPRLLPSGATTPSDLFWRPSPTSASAHGRTLDALRVPDGRSPFRSSDRLSVTSMSMYGAVPRSELATKSSSTPISGASSSATRNDGSDHSSSRSVTAVDKLHSVHVPDAPLSASSSTSSSASPDSRFFRPFVSYPSKLFPAQTLIASHGSVISNLSTYKEDLPASAEQARLSTVARAMFFLGFLVPVCWLVGGWLIHHPSPNGPVSRSKSRRTLVSSSQSKFSFTTWSEPEKGWMPSSPMPLQAPHPTPLIGVGGYFVPLRSSDGLTTYDLEMAGLGSNCTRIDKWVKRCRVAAVVGGILLLAGMLVVVVVVVHEHVAAS